MSREQATRIDAQCENDPADGPLLSFWRELIPDDFDPTDTRKVASLDLELSGIERGFGFLRHIENHAPIRGKRVLDIGAGNAGSRP
jgi:hypothetical protein